MTYQKWKFRSKTNKGGPVHSGGQDMTAKRRDRENHSSNNMSQPQEWPKSGLIEHDFIPNMRFLPHDRPQHKTNCRHLREWFGNMAQDVVSG